MASSSSMGNNNNNNKAKELQNKKKQEDGKMESGNNKNQREQRKSMHAKMDWDWIKVFRNQKNWGQEEQNLSMRTVITEDEIHEMELMSTFDFDYVLKNHLLADEQIVWEDDVWGLQNFHPISTSYDNHAPTLNNSSHN